MALLSQSLVPTSGKTAKTAQFVERLPRSSPTDGPMTTPDPRVVRKRLIEAGMLRPRRHEPWTPRVVLKVDLLWKHEVRLSRQVVPWL